MGAQRAVAQWHLGSRGLACACSFASSSPRREPTLSLGAPVFSLEKYGCCFKVQIRYFMLCFVNCRVLKKIWGHVWVFVFLSASPPNEKEDGIKWHPHQHTSPLVLQPSKWKLLTKHSTWVLRQLTSCCQERTVSGQNRSRVVCLQLRKRTSQVYEFGIACVEILHSHQQNP